MGSYGYRNKVIGGCWSPIPLGAMKTLSWNTYELENSWGIRTLRDLVHSAGIPVGLKTHRAFVLFET